MCRLERNTDRRGLPPLFRLIWPRTRRWRRPRRSFALGMSDLLLLAFLAENLLVVVLDALALVRLGRAERPNLGSHLSDPLLVGAGDGDDGRLLALDRHVGGNRIDDVVAEAELQLQVLALHGGAIAHA